MISTRPPRACRALGVVCVNCAFPADHLYTTYKTPSNIRLGVCVSPYLAVCPASTEPPHQPRCHAFLDPLIEHPPLVLLLDLILLKPRVFLHLLFNRGSRPLSTTKPVDDEDERGMERDRVLWKDLVRLAGLTVVAETAVRVLPDFSVALAGLAWVLGGVLAELVAQHLTTLGLALVILRLRRWYPLPLDRTSTLR